MQCLEFSAVKDIALKSIKGNTQADGRTENGERAAEKKSLGKKRKGERG